MFPPGLPFVLSAFQQQCSQFLIFNILCGFFPLPGWTLLESEVKGTKAYVAFTRQNNIENCFCRSSKHIEEVED